MNNFLILLGYSFTVGLTESIIFLLAAIILGFSIHFYWTSQKNASLPEQDDADDSRISDVDRERLQFYEQVEKHEKTQERLEKELLRMNESEKKLLRELEETREEVRRLEKQSEQITIGDAGHTKQHMSDLVMAQQHLHESLSKEMTERLSKAYEEFNFLQDRIQKMQSQLFDPQKRNFKFEDLEQSYIRITREYDELKLKHIALLEEHQQLVRNYADNEEKLKDALFDKQQLSKKVAFLEDMVNDLQQVSGHNKKLEGQLRRLGEIEKLLSRTGSSER
jgi:chromosome segregation ATPase